MSNRTLESLATEQTSTKIYLVELGLKSPTTEDKSDHRALGLDTYPRGYNGRDPVFVYRFLGTNKNDLDCESTILIATPKKTTPEGFQCAADDVESLLIPHYEYVPYVDMSYGSSLIDDLTHQHVRQPLGERRCICLANRTGKDLHFHWTQDVHQDDVWDFVRNNETACRKSRKTNGAAHFTLELFKNDNGNVGRRLGQGTIGIQIPCAIGASNCNLFVEHVSGDAHIYVLTEEQVIETIARIAWAIWA